MKRILILIIFLIVVVLGAFIIYKEGGLAPDKTSTKAKIFVVNRGEGLNAIAQNLHNAGLIRSRVVFYLVVKELGIEKKIQAGDFRLSPAMNAYDVAKTLTHGTLDIWVTLVEGLRKEEVAQIFAEQMQIPEVEFINKAQEGYLFPDTYLMPRQATAETVISILSHNFDTKFDTVRLTKAKQIGLTEAQVVTLASIVEREARTPGVKQEVASIIMKRLQLDMPIQSDTTIQYALGYQPGEKTWWKKDITFADLEIDSPYNTYLHKGLPAGPICNPGLTSIDAVLNADPKSTPYLFYIADSQGHMHYAKTAQEHQQNVDKYLR